MGVIIFHILKFYEYSYLKNQEPSGLVNMGIIILMSIVTFKNWYLKKSRTKQYFTRNTMFYIKQMSYCDIQPRTGRQL